MKYVIMTLNGFQQRGSEAALYDTVEEAMAKAAPGDSIVPVNDKAEVIDMEQERNHRRMPPYNRSGLRK